MAKLALNDTMPLNLLAFRFIGAFAVLSVIVLAMRLPLPKLSQNFALMGTGLFLHVGHFGSVYVGLKLGASASIMALFAACQPVLIIISTALLQRKMPAWQVWCSLMLGLLGAAIIVGVDMQGDSGYVLGAVLGFFAVIGLSLGQVIEKQRQLGVHPFMATWVQYGFACLIAAPIALYIEGLVYTLTLPLILSVGYLAIVNSIIGIMLMFSMVRSGSIASVSAIMFLVPAVGALIAWPVVGEVPKLLMLPGFALAMLGALWTRHLTNTQKVFAAKPSD